MKAIIVTGGKQYTVSEGDILFVEKLNAEEEAVVKFDEVLAILDGENSKIGAPVVEGAVVEAKAIKNLFGEHAYKLNISSTKSMTGHLLGAAGALEAMFTVLAINNDIVPPTINHAEGDDDPDIDYGMNFTFNKAQKRNVNVAISNTFGFGGHNACIAFKKVES